jgi:hypothetical protein
LKQNKLQKHTCLRLLNKRVLLLTGIFQLNVIGVKKKASTAYSSINTMLID